MSNEPGELSIIIPAYGPPIQLADLLLDLSLQDLDPARLEVIVVDDGSPVPLGPQLRNAQGDYPVRLRVVEKPNGGAPAARNFGAALAKNNHILFLDQDLRIPDNFVRIHLEIGQAFKNAAVSAAYRNEPLESSGSFPRWYMRQASTWTRVTDAQGTTIANGVREIHPLNLSSTNCSLPRSVFLESGGFPVFRYSGMEDQAFGLVLNRLGVKTLQTNLTVARHVESRMELAPFCRRQKTGAAGAAEFASRFPEVLGSPGQTEWHKNWGPARRADPIPLLAKKLARGFLSTSLGGTVLSRAVRTAESAASAGRVLDVLYAVAVGAALQAGWREGFAAQLDRK